MIPSALLSALVMGVAFCVGYAVRRTGICAVAAARQSVLHRRHTRMRAFLLAACWSGVVLLPAAWLFPDAVHLSPGYPVTAAVLLGGALYGVGAWINGACAFGTLAHISGGDTNFFGTLAGAFAGALSASLVGSGMARMYASPLSEPGLMSAVALLIFGAAASYGFRRGVWPSGRGLQTIRLRISRLGASSALVVIGVGGGFLYAVAGQWTYMAVLSDRAAQLVMPDGVGIGVPALLGVLATFAGALFAAVRGGQFRLKPPRLRSVAQRFAGGGAMGFAAALIPGGNDVMVVYNLPSAAGHAIAAYAVMMAVLCAFLAIRNRFQRSPRTLGCGCSPEKD